MCFALQWIRRRVTPSDVEDQPLVFAASDERLQGKASYRSSSVENDSDLFGSHFLT